MTRKTLVHLLLLLLMPLSLFAGFGQTETENYTIVVQDMNRIEALKRIIPSLPIPPGDKPVLVTVRKKPSAPEALEYRITLRFIGVDGNTYRQSLTAEPLQAGSFGKSFYVKAVDVLSVDIEAVNPPIIEEAH